MSDLNEVNSHLANSSSKIMITEEETANGLLSCILQIRFYSAGCHLQRTGDTMAPSFLSWAKALSTSLRSSPERVANIPVFYRDVPEGTVTFDVGGIEVFRLASP